ncbi:MAG: membrane protein insertase YidC [Candidatus Methylomirabilales bacterium]
MERNAILATVLVIAILLGYQWYLAQFEAPAPPPAPTREAPPSAKAPAPPAPGPSAAPAPPAPPRGYTPTARIAQKPQDVVVETPLMRVVLTTEGARAKSWQLKNYRLDSGAPVELVAVPDPATAGALGAWADAEQVAGIFQVDSQGLDLTGEKKSGTLTFTHVSAAGIQLEKQLTFEAHRYRVDVGLKVKNLSAAEMPVQARLAWGPGFRNSTDKKNASLQPPTFWVNGARVQEDTGKLNGEKILDGTISWAAVQDNYFAAALLPGEKGFQAFAAKAKDDQPVVGLTTPRQSLPPGGQASLEAQVFAGPKDLDILKGVGQNLDQLVDLGWFAFLARPALWLLKFLYTFTGNYGVAIILVTILQKVLFHPLTHKSIKSMQAMQAVQPKIQAVQERYKNNPQKKQEEMMALYRKHGVNPMGGCLPMLVQIPIFIALYNALSSSVEMWQAGFLWIRDLTQADSLFNVAIWGGYDFSFNLLALLMGASMWLQQKMSPPAGDPRQAQMMLWMMPIIFTFMFWSFPSGLVLYWLVNNVLQIGQQWLIMRKPARPQPEGQPA